MDCVYCILQAYLNNPWLSFFVNIEDLFVELEVALGREPERFFRIGTGEFTDSLALDSLTHLSPRLVRFIADQVAVMYLGQIVEHGPVDALYAPPYHPYTEALLSAIPVPDPAAHKQRIVLPGEPPSPISPPDGCHFHPRCPRATGLGRSTYPDAHIQPDGRFVACHLFAR